LHKIGGDGFLWIRWRAGVVLQQDPRMGRWPLSRVVAVGARGALAAALLAVSARAEGEQQPEPATPGVQGTATSDSGEQKKPPPAKEVAPAPAAPVAVASAPHPLAPVKAAILRSLARARRGDPPEPAPQGASFVDRYVAALGIADDDEAWPVFKQLSLEAPREPWGELGQARIYVHWKLPDQASGAFGRAMAYAPQHGIALVERAIAYRAFGNPAAARIDAEAALAQDPHDARALVVLAQLAEDAGAPPAEQKAAWLRALEQSADLFEARAALAAIAEAEGDQAAAREGVEALAQMSPRDLLLQRKLAGLRKAAGDAVGAAQAYEAAIALGDGSKESWAGLAAARRAAKDFAGEEKVLQRLRRIDPKDRTVMVRLFNLRAAAKDPAGMEEMGKLLLTLDAKDAGAWLAIAISRGQRGDVLGQLEALGAAVRGNPHPEAKGAPERAKEELQDLRERLGVPPKPLLAANYDGLYFVASKHLTKLYEARRTSKPELAGKLGIKIRIGNAGGADAVEVTEDTLGEPDITGGLVVALKEGAWPKGQKTLNLKFDLAPPGSRPPEHVRETPRKVAAKAAPPAPPPPPPKRAESASDLLSPK
jgi:hypothetical protein